MAIELLPGDVFCVQTQSALAKGIRAVQAFWAHDSNAIYNHSGVILDHIGTTFEALTSYRKQDLFTAYSGRRVIIARPDISQFTIKPELTRLQQRYSKKRFYPYWRLPMHAFPPLAKISLYDWDVCSELTAWFLYQIGARPIRWPGTNPDTLADEFIHWRIYKLIHEGFLP